MKDVRVLPRDFSSCQVERGQFTRPEPAPYHLEKPPKSTPSRARCALRAPVDSAGISPPPFSSVVTPSNKKSVTRHNTADQTVVRHLWPADINKKPLISTGLGRGTRLVQSVVQLAPNVPTFAVKSARQRFSLRYAIRCIVHHRGGLGVWASPARAQK
jgi:hypothetical protein